MNKVSGRDSLNKIQSLHVVASAHLQILRFRFISADPVIPV